MVDRSPEGKLHGGRRLPAQHGALQLEDVPGEHQRHGASAVDARVGHRRRAACGKGTPDRRAKPMAMEQILPFAPGYDFFDNMGGRIHANGHSVLGIHFSMHSNYGSCPSTRQPCRPRTASGARGRHPAAQPQNAVFYPSLSLKGSPQAIRVIRPLAADRTLVEAWSFRVGVRPDCCC
jgi:hypothetical protein